jgi:hypothetical protein
VPKTKIEPEKITKPFQLLAVWMAGLVLLVGSFLTAAGVVTGLPWLRGVFGIAAVAIVPIFVILIFLMQTKFRPQLQEDPFYAGYLKQQAEQFKDFQPENVSPTPSRPSISPHSDDFRDEYEERRINRYKENQGLFLIHTWRFSRIPGQVADVAISLYQHGTGPLSEGKVKSVEYHLGPKFFRQPIVKTNVNDNFRLDVAAYGSMLCLARVNCVDDTPPLDLERYINF